MLGRAKAQSSWRHAASAATAAVVLVICGSPLVPSRSDQDPVAAALAELPHRPTVARLSGDAVYRAYKTPYVPLEASRNLDETLKAHPRADRRSQSHALGIAALLRRDHPGAIRFLREAVALAEAQPIGPVRRAAILNDFAVAHYEHARAGIAKSFIVALEASEKAWALDRTPATAWTRAVLLSALARSETAASAWDDYLALDSTSRWAKEVARERKMFPPRVAERVSADAAQLRARTSLATMPALASGSVFIAKCDTAIGEFLLADDPDGAARALLLRAKMLDTMRASDEAWRDRVKARALASNETVDDAVTSLASAATREGNLLAASVLSSAAIQVMRGSGVIHFAGHATMVPGRRPDWSSILQELEESQIAHDLANGSPAAALWKLQQRRTPHIDFRKSTLPCLGDPTGVSAEVMGQRLARCLPHGVTFVQQELDVENLYTWVLRDGTVDFTRTRVTAAILVDQIEALNERIRGRWSMTTVSSEAQRLYDVLLAPVQRQIAGQGELVYSSSPVLRRDPLSSLHDGKQYLAESRPITVSPSLPAFVSMRKIAAITSPRSSFLNITFEPREFTPDDFHLGGVETAVSESLRRLYEREARIEGANGVVAASLWMSDRARIVTEPQEQSSPCSDDIRRGTLEELGSQLARCVPDGVTLIHQDLDAENLYTWVVRDGQITFTTSRVSAPRLIAEIEQFQADIERNADAGSLLAQARSLHEVLLGPVRQQLADSDLLVFSPSADLRNVPFHALHDGSAFLVQQRLSTTTATISAFELPRALANTASALVVLPPVGPERQELLGARSEARTVTKIYGPRAALLTGDAATPEAFLGSAASYDILHVATHGQSSNIPNQNSIEFGPRFIRAYDIFQLDLTRAPVVMLAACRTADESGGPSNVSLSNAFLAAGASAVIGTLWDVEDRATEQLSIAFHRELTRGATPQDALRNVQLQFIQSGKPVSAWAAFRVSS